MVKTSKTFKLKDTRKGNNQSHCTDLGSNN